MKTENGISDKKVLVLVIVVLGGIILLWLLRKPIIAYATVNEGIVTVTKTDIKRSGSDTDIYLVYTDQGTFKIQDNLWHWQWRSSDLYGKIKAGNKYRIKCYGFRWGFRSWYKNIYEAEEVE